MLGECISFQRDCGGHRFYSKRRERNVRVSGNCLLRENF